MELLARHLALEHFEFLRFRKQLFKCIFPWLVQNMAAGFTTNLNGLPKRTTNNLGYTSSGNQADDSSRKCVCFVLVGPRYCLSEKPWMMFLLRQLFGPNWQLSRVLRLITTHVVRPSTCNWTGTPDCYIRVYWRIKSSRGVYEHLGELIYGLM